MIKLLNNNDIMTLIINLVCYFVISSLLELIKYQKKSALSLTRMLVENLSCLK